MKCAIEVGKPDWRPLENAMPPEFCEEFMFMGKAGDIVLYKHRLTRRYLNIDCLLYTSRTKAVSYEVRHRSGQA